MVSIPATLGGGWLATYCPATAWLYGWRSAWLGSFLLAMVFVGVGKLGLNEGSGLSREG